MGSSPPLSPDAVHAAVLSRVDRKWRASGSLSVPAVPALLDVYMARFAALFEALGKGFTDPELLDLRALVATRLVDGFRESPHARFHLSWEPQAPPDHGVNYKVWLDTATVQEQYEHWAATKTPPLFGVNADGKVLDLAARYLDPGTAPALDLGAGTGRNALPLARAGHPTHAVELTAAFVTALRESAAAEALPVTALEGDVVRGELDLPGDHFALIVCSEVTSHFRGVADLRALFARVASWLRPGGTFVVNCFVAADDHVLTELERQVSEVTWSSVFTRAELADVCSGLPLVVISDEDAHDYERAHQPTWPPTGWFADWARGFDLYNLKPALPPVAMRWLTFRRSEPDTAPCAEVRAPVT